VSEPSHNLTISSLTAGYRNVVVVQDVSLEVPPAMITLIVGANGSGKSTLLKATFGLVKIFSGTVELGGVELVHEPIRSRIGAGIRYVPQYGGIFPSLSVDENLRLAAGERTSKTAANALEVVHAVFPTLPTLLHRRAGELSGGQQRLVSFAMGIATRPRFLLIDEPSAGLSPALTEQVHTHLATICADFGTGILLVEQNVSAACEVAAFVHVMQDGVLAWSGEPEALLAHEGLVAFL
jgi:branched-chain amino acid transport system ATP-binding protein